MPSVSATSIASIRSNAESTRSGGSSAAMTPRAGTPWKPGQPRAGRPPPPAPTAPSDRMTTGIESIRVPSMSNSTAAKVRPSSVPRLPRHTAQRRWRARTAVRSRGYGGCGEHAPGEPTPLAACVPVAAADRRARAALRRLQQRRGRGDDALPEQRGHAQLRRRPAALAQPQRHLDDPEPDRSSATSGSTSAAPSPRPAWWRKCTSRSASPTCSPGPNISVQSLQPGPARARARGPRRRRSRWPGGSPSAPSSSPSSASAGMPRGGGARPDLRWTRGGRRRVGRLVRRDVRRDRADLPAGAARQLHDDRASSARCSATPTCWRGSRPGPSRSRPT